MRARNSRGCVRQQQGQGLCNLAAAGTVCSQQQQQGLCVLAAAGLCKLAAGAGAVCRGCVLAVAAAAGAGAVCDSVSALHTVVALWRILWIQLLHSHRYLQHSFTSANYVLILYETCILDKHENFNHGKYYISLTDERYHLSENHYFFTPQILWDLTTMNCDILMRGRRPHNRLHPTQ